MLLGGTVAGAYSGPEEWEQLLIRSRFKAVTAPFNMYTPRKETEAYLAACDRQGVLIAEIGVWKNPSTRIRQPRRRRWPMPRDSLPWRTNWGLPAA